jgi:hypothetical protein
MPPLPLALPGWRGPLDLVRRAWFPAARIRHRYWLEFIRHFEHTSMTVGEQFASAATHCASKHTAACQHR